VPEPKKDKKPRAKSRFRQLQEINSEAIKLPEIESKDQFIIKYLDEIGWYSQGFSGIEPISWQELAAWKQATGTIITPSECSLLIGLSRAYVAQYYASEDPACPNPLAVEVEDKATLANNWKTMFAQASKAP